MTHYVVVKRENASPPDFWHQMEYIREEPSSDGKIKVLIGLPHTFPSGEWIEVNESDVFDDVEKMIKELRIRNISRIQDSMWMEFAYHSYAPMIVCPCEYFYNLVGYCPCGCGTLIYDMLDRIQNPDMEHAKMKGTLLGECPNWTCVMKSQGKYFYICLPNIMEKTEKNYPKRKTMLLDPNG